MSSKFLISFLFVIAFLLRLLLVPNPGFEADVSFWKSWGLATRDFGIVEGIKQTNNNYPTPFAYTLGLMVKLYSLFADPHNFNEFWQNTNLTFLAISKLFPILADLGIAAIILYMGQNTLSLLLAVFYLFNPVSLIDGAWWGQVDSLGVFIFLIALLLSLKRQPFWAGAVFMLSMMTKLQNMIYGPLFFLFIWQSLGFDGLRKAILGATVGFFGLNIEFFLSKNMDRVIASLTSNYDYFPWMSLNAFNVWWIVSGGHGMQVSDKLLAIGIVNAKTVGLLMFSSFYLFALVRQRKNLQSFLESLIIVNASFFLFMTESHDRYLFPTSVFLLLWAPFYKNFRVFSVFYILFSLVYFYNLHSALVFNYPNNGLPGLSQLIQPTVTITASVLLIALFVIFLLFLTRYSLAVFAVIVLGITALNFPLYAKQPMSLTKFTPYISTQDFGSRQTNKSVNSSYGINSWNRLSVQYMFYKKGIGTHTNSRHVFAINSKFKRFSTDFGVDTESGPQASVIFEIYGDDKLLFRSETMKKYDYPRHTEVNIEGIKFLSLVTTDAGDGNIDDHTDWLNPMLYP
ncbi:hypothetical protein A3A79_02035 [Candidatus Gottesmanbacteria bacterium RIFCSPLOWO2_01_FULL_43_11b]|uniref:Glycosyl hydrolase family 98 putative carbohydrate-binding module domain-containing protein n=1 Tax=Candidatus Gottesmanbacteria bacterium RIFCSPLOWO2_01_FULL_43_11b TaxID=1798392 RepID=A0A1F6AGS8_9BACT|nr:MAG: hypothetical protein A3A79_02035 [Candidatus Gottesmanbacteria bacterium RIFCSPLOWO2_01_FULL_43_11b]